MPILASAGCQWHCGSRAPEDPEAYRLGADRILDCDDMGHWPKLVESTTEGRMFDTRCDIPRADVDVGHALEHAH